jgi:hypothetical protein
MRNIVLSLLLLLLGVGLAAAQEVPKRKSGLWEITRISTRNGEKPTKVQLCVDQATDKLLLQLAEGMRGETCTTQKLGRTGDKLTVDATCKIRGSTSTTHAVITGNFDSAYKIESTSTYKPPLYSETQGHAVFDAKWTGPCTAGQRPGDMTLPNGTTVNLNDNPQGKAPAPARPPGFPPIR